MPIDPETKKILDNRLASGEIGKEEYRELLSELEGAEVNATVAGLPTSPLPVVLPAAPAALPPTPAREKDDVLFSDNSFTVTRNRFITPGQTYSMRNITSVKYTKSTPNYAIAIILMIIGFPLLFALMSKARRNFDLEAVILSFGVVGGIGFAYIWHARPTYDVCLITTAGEVRALRSKDEEYTSRLVGALNKAISQQ